MFYSTITKACYSSLNEVIKGHDQYIGFSSDHSLITVKVLQELGIHLIDIENPGVSFDTANEKKVLSDVIESTGEDESGQQIKVFSARWNIVSKTQQEKDDEASALALEQEQKKSHIRISRDSMLKSSDWTQLPDAPLTTEQKAEWAVYRQQLRDVTTQAGFPNNVTWPTKPGS